MRYGIFFRFCILNHSNNTATNKDNYIKNDTIDYLLHTNNAELLNLKGNQAVFTDIRDLYSSAMVSEYALIYNFDVAKGERSVKIYNMQKLIFF